MSRRRNVVAAVSAVVVFAAVVILCHPSDGELPAGPGSNVAANDRASRQAHTSKLPNSLAPSSALAAVGEGDRNSAQFSLKVVDVSGTPVVGCQVLGWSEAGEHLVTHATDELGIARFAADDGRGVIAAVQATGRWAIAEVQWRGQHTLTVGGPAVVAGIVLVDGAPAPQGMEIAITTSGAALPFEVPPGLEERLRELLASSCYRTTTDVGGAFAFVGLPSNWRGTLLPPDSHWLVPSGGESWQPRRHQLLAPAANLVVQLTLLPAVSGRVIWDDDESPVAAVHVRAVVDYEDMTRASGTSSSSQDGLFTVPLTPTAGSRQARWALASDRPSASRTAVTCWSVPGSLQAAEVTIPGSESVQQLFVIRLQRASKTHFSVVDQVGKPIAGARVNVAGSSSTDDHGRGYFQGHLTGRRVLLAGAQGYAVTPVQEVSGDGVASSPLAFVLPPVNRLNIRIEGLQSAAELHDVRIESSKRLFAGSRRWSEFDSQFGGSQCSSGTSGRAFAGGFRRVETLEVVLDGQGHAALHSVEPGIECALIVRGRLGRILVQGSFHTPAYGQELSVVVAVDSDLKPRCVFGAVATVGGAPLENAEVKLLAGSPRLSTRTKEDGTFRFDAFYIDAPVDLVVRASGYAGVRLIGLLRGVDDTPHEFRLVPGRAVSVHVFDQAGVPVDLFAKPEGFEDQEAQSVGIGVYRWADLPQSVVFYATVQGRVFSVQHDTRNSEAILRVPELGIVSLPTSAFPDSGGWSRDDCRVEFRCIEHPDRGLIRLGFSDDPRDQQYVLPGRYSVDLVTQRVRADGVREFGAVGHHAEIDVLAGKLTSITFD